MHIHCGLKYTQEKHKPGKELHTPLVYQNLLFNALHSNPQNTFDPTEHQAKWILFSWSWLVVGFYGTLGTFSLVVMVSTAKSQKLYWYTAEKLMYFEKHNAVELPALTCIVIHLPLLRNFVRLLGTALADSNQYIRLSFDAPLHKQSRIMRYSGLLKR